MSRSFRHTPIIGRADSEKKDKKIWHRRMRARCRQIVHYALFLDAENALMPLNNDITNTWCMSKDGKFRFDPQQEEGWFPRKSSQLCGGRRWMRK